MDSRLSESSSISRSDHSDFEPSMKCENNDRAHTPVFLNQAWRFEPLERPKIERESRANIFILEILKIVYVS